MALQEYRKKRNFSRTPEPQGNTIKSRSSSFVVQKHAASRLHYDFRLELDGVLKSWAVPKGPSMIAGEKRLAVEVEDHPLEYGSFEGTIPQGEYGGGSVIVWDRGTWIPDGDARGAIRKGHIKFELDGERLKGRFALVRMKPRSASEESKHNWLLIKESEGAAGSKKDVTERYATSVVSGKTVDEIGKGKRVKTWSSKSASEKVSTQVNGSTQNKVSGTAKLKASKSSAKSSVKSKKRETPVKRSRSSSSLKKSSSAKAAKQKKNLTDLRSIAGAKKGTFPRGVSPQLCTLSTEVPSGDEWVHEIKLDGYRIIAALDHGKVSLFTRKGLDWTEKFEEIANQLTELSPDTALFDGEIVALNEGGKSDFQSLQRILKRDETGVLSYCVFDLLYLNGYDLRSATLLDRKSALASILPRGMNGAIYYSEHIEGSGEEFFRKACELGLEGIVSKDINAPYISRRTRSWLKIRCGAEQELIITGFTGLKAGGEVSPANGIGALLLGYYDRKGALRYAGKVGTGFDTADRLELYRKLSAIERKEAAFETPPGLASELRGARWVRPKLVAQIKFTEWTADGRLRHPVFHGLRGDKPANEIVREVPANAGASDDDESEGTESESTGRSKMKANARRKERNDEEREGASRSTKGRQGKRTSEKVEVGGVEVSHPERIIDQKSGTTKLDLVRYYHMISERMLPYIEGRAIVMVRYPAGIEGEHFFHKHANETFPKDLPRVKVKESSGSESYLTVHTPAHLLQLAQFNAIELHTFGYPFDRSQADQMVFDLDPGPDVSWAKVGAAAKRIRDLLATVDLESFVKVSGGKGLHVVVPIKRGPNIEAIAELSRAIASKLAGDDPEAFTATMSKAKRKGKIFIDYLRNSAGGTSVAVYSARGRPGIPISMPISWDQLRIAPDSFTLQTASKKIPSRAADPWKDFLKVRQSFNVQRIKKLEKMLQQD